MVEESRQPEAGGRDEPAWLDRIILDALHGQLIAEFGGSPGVRDDGLIESALARPIDKWGYAESGIAELAAAYAFGLAKNHGFVDGNKRIAATAMGVFLDLNGYDLDAPQAELVDVMLALADGTLSETELARWVASRARRFP